MLMAFSNELDIFLPQTLKDKMWNLEYIDLSLLLRQNVYFPNENQNCIAVDNGRLVLQSVNNSFEKAINIGVCVSFVQGIFNRFAAFTTIGSACTP
jgi:hypothetical protein